MIICIDIGNTNIKYAIYDKDELKISFRVATDLKKTSDEYGAQLTSMLAANGVEVKALNGVSITFPSSGLVFISGKSGCGKTTLLNVIGGIDGIDEGEIFVQDKKLSQFSASESLA